MSLRITNRKLIEKIDELALVTGSSKTRAVEIAVERLLLDLGKREANALVAALLGKIDQIPDRGDAFYAHEWGDVGQPR